MSKTILITGSEIRDRDSFHSVFSEALGFPDFYGRNLDAFLDCLRSVALPQDGMMREAVAPGEVLRLVVTDAEGLRVRCPDLYAYLVEITDVVNGEYEQRGEQAPIDLVLQPGLTSARGATDHLDVVWCESLAEWPHDLLPGALLLAIDATVVETDAIGAVAERCLRGPLGVVVCWGPDCGRVHDIFEETDVVAHVDGWRPAEVEWTMSTWHSDEPLNEAFEMLRMQIAACEPQRPHVVVVVGSRQWFEAAHLLAVPPA